MEEVTIRRGLGLFKIEQQPSKDLTALDKDLDSIDQVNMIHVQQIFSHKNSGASKNRHHFICKAVVAFQTRIMNFSATLLSILKPLYSLAFQCCSTAISIKLLNQPARWCSGQSVHFTLVELNLIALSQHTKSFENGVH